MRQKKEPLCCYVRYLLRILKAWNEVLISTFFKSVQQCQFRYDKEKMTDSLEPVDINKTEKLLKKDPRRREELKRF